MPQKRKLRSDEYCETHRRLRTDGDLNNNQADKDAGPSHTIPTMPSKKPTYSRVVIYNSSSRDSDSMVPNVDKESSDTDSNSEENGLKAEIGRQIETLLAETPTMTSPFGCSTAKAPTEKDKNSKKEWESLVGLNIFEKVSRLGNTFSPPTLGNLTVSHVTRNIQYLVDTI